MVMVQNALSQTEVEECVHLLNSSKSNWALPSVVAYCYQEPKYVPGAWSFIIVFPLQK